MPGLNDAHWHCLFANLPLAGALTADTGYVVLVDGAEADYSPPPLPRARAPC